MAAPRLPFLWPMLAKPTTEVYNPAVRSARTASRIKTFQPSTRRRQHEPATQRYGTANEPPPHLGGGKGLGPSTIESSAEPAKALPKIGEKLQRDGEKQAKAERQKSTTEEQKTQAATVDGRMATQNTIDPMLDSSEAIPLQAPLDPPNLPDDKPLESVLEFVPDPAQQKREEQEEHAEEHPDRSFDEHSPPVKAPHMETPRHVHHFDTYGLVKRLGEGEWNQEQAITIMKAVRLMLADNTDLAKEALVSKSNLENEAYLFKAACAELRTEVMSRRKREQEKMRTERTQLQHEVDILSQRVGQESGTLKDELKGMFDDRKMAARNEQREMESKIQQLNYRITVSLQADAKSEVEGLRWVMTRRVIIALGSVVLMVIGSLKLFSNAAHEAEEVAKKRGKQRSGGTQTDDSVFEGGSGGEIGGRREGQSLGGGEVLVKEGDNPAFVSLG